MNILQNLPKLVSKDFSFGNHVFMQSRNMAVAPKKAGKGAAAGKPKKVLDVETDPEKLANFCCGANYKLDGEPIELKPKEEYPDWLFTMDIKRPKPKSWEIEDKNSKEFFEACREEARHKWKRLHKQGLIGLRDKK